MTEVVNNYYRTNPRHARQAADMDRVMPDWINVQAEEHQTFKLWAQFLLEDYPAYLALSIGLSTGDFKLRLAALRRIAPVCCGYGKDWYQWLVSVHLADMTKMTDDDFKALPSLFSTSLGGDAFARFGLDEKQKVANRLY